MLHIQMSSLMQNYEQWWQNLNEQEQLEFVMIEEGYVLITPKFATIPLNTPTKIEGTSHWTPNLQSLVEELELHMLIVCSSSVDVQASLIKDRS